jgi:hypothetical protein
MMGKHKDKFYRGLLHDLYICFLEGKAIPKDLSDAFIKQFLQGYHGEVRSWDDAFGKPTRYGTYRNIERETEQGHLVADEVARVKRDEGSLNEEEFAAIGKRTGVGSSTKVKELLNSNRFWTERVNRLIELGREISKNYRR